MHDAILPELWGGGAGEKKQASVRIKGLFKPHNSNALFQ